MSINISNKICKECNVEFYVKPSKFDRAKYCSNICRLKNFAKFGRPIGLPYTDEQKLQRSIRASQRVGESSPNWRGGKSRAYKTGYYSIEYKLWRTAVFERDSYICQICNISGNKTYLTAHHIKSFAHYPELRFKLDNGQTLCELCHSKTDNYKGRGKRKK